MSKRAQLDTLRSLGWAGIGATYVAVGGAFAHPARIICITNTTDADMIFSDDKGNATGKLIVPKGSFKLYDLTTNEKKIFDDDMALPVGTIIYVKQVAAPSSGSVYVEVTYS